MESIPPSQQRIEQVAQSLVALGLVVSQHRAALVVRDTNPKCRWFQIRLGRAAIYILDETCSGLFVHQGPPPLPESLLRAVRIERSPKSVIEHASDRGWHESADLDAAAADWDWIVQEFPPEFGMADVIRALGELGRRYQIDHDELLIPFGNADSDVVRLSLSSNLWHRQTPSHLTLRFSDELVLDLAAEIPSLFGQGE